MLYLLLLLLILYQSKYAARRDSTKVVVKGIPSFVTSKRLASGHHLPFPPFASSLIGGDASRADRTGHGHKRNVYVPLEQAVTSTLWRRRWEKKKHEQAMTYVSNQDWHTHFLQDLFKNQN
jgi:hypothetical protein